MLKYFLLILIFTFQFEIISQQYGFIQIKSEPNIEIYLDDEFKGVTDRKYDGLILENINIGYHIIEARKEGYTPQKAEINIESNQVFLFQVNPFIPKIEIKEEGEKEDTEINLKVGSLIVQSIPIECTITIPSLGTWMKKKDKWIADKIAEGYYKIIFSNSNDKEITFDLNIYEGKETHLLVNFLNREVKLISNVSSDNLTDYYINPIDTSSTYFLTAEEMPEPIGGLSSIQSKVIYPIEAKKDKIEGKVYILAFINERGIVTKTQVLKGLGFGLDESASNAILQTKFTPGKIRGKPVKVQVSIPIMFKLN